MDNQVEAGQCSSNAGFQGVHKWPQLLLLGTIVQHSHKFTLMASGIAILPLRRAGCITNLHQPSCFSIAGQIRKVS